MGDVPREGVATVSVEDTNRDLVIIDAKVLREALSRLHKAEGHVDAPAIVSPE